MSFAFIPSFFFQLWDEFLCRFLCFGCTIYVHVILMNFHSFGMLQN